MSGTMINNVKLVKVVDGDTLRVEIEGKNESLRLLALDTEESYSGGSKPVTNAGKLASEWAKSYFGADEGGFLPNPVFVDIEFDTNDPVPVSLRKHRGNFGRLLCYVHKNGENYNLSAISEGWSPYFVKYGRSRLYHNLFLDAEASAQAKGVAIWDPNTNAGGKTRDYAQLIPWWYLRGAVVEDYRSQGIQAGIKSVRLDYDDIVEAAKAASELTVFCDLQRGVNKWTGGGALIYAGSLKHKFNLWIPEIESPTTQEILRLIELRYVNYGRSYAYVSGKASLYPDNKNGKPQIVITDLAQIVDAPHGV